MSATPGKQLTVYEAVIAAAAASGHGVCTRASRFDPGGGVLFFTIVDDSNQAISDERASDVRPALEEAAAGAGAYLLGAWTPSLQPYFKALRLALDPSGTFNPSVG